MWPQANLNYIIIQVRFPLPSFVSIPQLKLTMAITISGSILGPVTFSAMDFWPGVTGMQFPPGEQTSFLLRKQWVVHNNCATTAPVGMYFLIDWYCSKYGPVIGKNISTFSLTLAGATASFCTMKASQQRKSVLVGLRLILLCPTKSDVSSSRVSYFVLKGG